jgi:hypothetical protein
MPRYRYAPLPAALLLCACVSLPPEGPAVMALPGSGRTFEQFRLDDQICRDFAGRSIGPQTPAGAAVDSAAASAVLGTAIGAAVGAAVDGSSGAAVGAGFGLLVGKRQWCRCRQCIGLRVAAALRPELRAVHVRPWPQGSSDRRPPFASRRWRAGGTGGAAAATAAAAWRATTAATDAGRGAAAAAWGATVTTATVNAHDAGRLLA